MKVFFRRISLLLLVLTFTALSTQVYAVSGHWVITNRTTGGYGSGLYWTSITSNSDGTKLAAVENGGDIWTSTDSGATWVNQTTGGYGSGLYWSSITSNSDGTKLAAVENGGDIWTSSDSGATWVNQTTGGYGSGLYWSSITSNSDGTKLAAVDSDDDSLGNGDIWTLEYIPDEETPDTPTTPTVTRNAGVIPLEFLQQMNQANRVKDTATCTITVNNVSTACSPQTIPAITTPASGIASIFKFYRDLKLGMTGDDVKELQKYLNTHGYILANSGAGSPNNETTYFGNLTRQAVIRYQTDHHITPNVGYFGFITRSSFEQNN